MCGKQYALVRYRKFTNQASSVFLTGDAAHTHSPKGGQGMNVSIQDSYNLIWKLGAVIANGADPSILETYDSERRPVAKKLMDLDERLVQAYEKEENDTSSGIYEVREKYAGFMAGVDVTYSHSILIAKGKKDDDSNLARNIELGMRLPSFPVVQMCDGVPLHLVQKLTSNGWWRILVFPGDLRQPARMKGLADFADYFSKHSHLTHLQRIQSSEWSCPKVELLLIQSCPRGAINLLDLPELFHPFDDIMGWDYWKTFADDRDLAYNGYGINKGGSGCLVLCRPDQHVAWIGSMEDTAGLDQYFSNLFPSMERKR
jgi:phenol 2-monooxygenase